VANGKVSDVINPSLGNVEHEEPSHEFTNEERNNREEYDSDNESFTSSLIAHRNTNPSSQDGSRASSVVLEQTLLPQRHTPVPEDAPVFHGHGKFKATLQALKLRQVSGNRAQGQGRETERAKDVEKEKDPSVAAGSEKSSENGSKDYTGTKKPPSLILPVISTQPSLPSASTSQSPITPTSTLPPSSPTITTAPTEVTTPPNRKQASREPTEPHEKPIKRPVVKVAKRTSSKQLTVYEPKSTRSQCRYRKISLPREEGGQRVTFCVPQCSLNDKELMKEEDIKDNGLATVRDFERLWDNVEEQNLSPYLIGVIRQLVGLDLLRENEIYYLPTDEEIEKMERRKKRMEERRKNRKSIGGTARENPNIAGHSGSVSGFGSTSQPALSQVEKRMVGPPPSFAESVSTSSTRSKFDRGGPARSISEGEVTDSERGRRTKKRRTKKEREGDSLRNTPSIQDDSAAPSVAGSPAPSQSTTERTPARRSQRALKKAVPTDAQAYKPSASSGESGEGEEEPEIAKKKRKSTRGGTKGLKRRRTEGTGDAPMPSVVGAGDHGPRSPKTARSKRAKIDEK
jgi:hypothetical protein